jgi:hypothetical protein
MGPDQHADRREHERGGEPADEHEHADDHGHADEREGADEHGHGDGESGGLGMYARFGAMILTGMVVMYAVMFVSAYEWSHVRFSVNRIFMALTMGGSMGLVMFAWMRHMYRNTKANLVVVAASLVLLGVGAYLDRSQATVGDDAFMRSMIPHHSMAITRSERATLDDVRACELAVEISEAQRREIFEMDWLLGDIARNGAARTREAAEARPVPDYEEPAERVCPGS